MQSNEVRPVVQATLAVLTRIARRTRSRADDLLALMLQGNEDRIAEAVARLVQEPARPLTDEQVEQALRQVGINV